MAHFSIVTTNGYYYLEKKKTKYQTNSFNCCKYSLKVKIKKIQENALFFIHYIILLLKQNVSLVSI